MLPCKHLEFYFRWRSCQGWQLSLWFFLGWKISTRWTRVNRLAHWQWGLHSSTITNGMTPKYLWPHVASLHPCPLAQQKLTVQGVELVSYQKMLRAEFLWPFIGSFVIVWQSFWVVWTCIIQGLVVPLKLWECHSIFYDFTKRW